MTTEGWKPFWNGVQVVINSRFIEMMTEARIFSHEKPGVQRWTPGDRLHFLRDVEMEAYAGIYRGEFLNSVGSCSFLTSSVNVNYHMQFAVGRYCSIAGGVKILGNDHPTSGVSSSPIFYDDKPSWVVKYRDDAGIADGPAIARPPAKGVPTVGHDVWFGSEVTLNQGVRIGHGAVVAANAHVVKDVPDYAIVGGNPARVLRYRFPDEIIQELLALQWWTYAPRDLRQLDPADIVSFVRRLRDARGQLQVWTPARISPWKAWNEAQC